MSKKFPSLGIELTIEDKKYPVENLKFTLENKVDSNELGKCFPISDADFRGTIDFSSNKITKKLFYSAKSIKIAGFTYKIYYRNFRLKRFYLEEMEKTRMGDAGEIAYDLIDDDQKIKAKGVWGIKIHEIKKAKECKK